jgi:fructose-1,6-bisphosphatase/inositol monophosphatase family enzyme
MPDVRRLLPAIVALHDTIRDSVLAACERQGMDALAAVAGDAAGDTTYVVDRVSEATLVDGLAEVARDEPIWLMAEGLQGGGLALPRGTAEDDCVWRVLADPIDGTRGLMFQKRPAWILTGVAPNAGRATRLRDIVLAVQTEIPLLKQHLSDQLWAVRGEGANAVRQDRLRASRESLRLRPSRSGSPAHGFATVVRFFPGARDVLAAIDDEVATAVLGPPVAGKAACFEDQYASTGGQLYELMAGHDRFIADLRPLVRDVLSRRGLALPLCCHPYDLCTALIAEELGVVVTDEHGRALDAPFDLDADVAWVGYANAALRERMEPALRAALAHHGMLPPVARQA